MIKENVLNYENSYKNYVDSLEIFLKEYFDSLENIEPELLNSIKYSLFPGGKRVRPVIMLAMYDLCGGKQKEIYKFAAAIEMIHTYSLIHDDLPCMDADTVRRGKPCNHIVYGEDTALLAGDALLTLAFDIVSNINLDSLPVMDANRILKCINILSSFAGCRGMISGQSLDLRWNDDLKSKDKLLKIYELKTGKIIAASAKIGAILGGASEDKVSLAEEFGKSIGISFQIVDDIIDNESNNLALLEDAEECVHDLTVSAKEKLASINENHWFLTHLVDSLAQRKK